MSTVEDQTLPQLYKELRDVEVALETKEPLLFAQYAYLRKAIALKEATREETATDTYKDLIPKVAIMKCLRIRGHWMSKRDIIKELENGGQIKDQINGKNLINDGIRYLLNDTKEIVTRDGSKLKRGPGSMDLEVGLPEFRKSSK